MRLHNITQNNILHYSVSIHIIYVVLTVYDSLGKYIIHTIVVIYKRIYLWCSIYYGKYTPNS